MNNQTTYKRVKINWWIILMLGGIYVWMIFAYIHQWGNNPIDKSGLIFIAIIWIAVLIFLGRFKVIIDSNYAVFRSDVWVPVRIPIDTIENVSVEQVSWSEIVHIPGGKINRYLFDYFVKQAIIIRLKNGIIYQISIKNAQRIKDEIEKQMNN